MATMSDLYATTLTFALPLCFMLILAFFHPDRLDAQVDLARFEMEHEREMLEFRLRYKSQRPMDTDGRDGRAFTQRQIFSS